MDVSSTTLLAQLMKYCAEMFLHVVESGLYTYISVLKCYKCHCSRIATHLLGTHLNAVCIS